MIRGFSFSHRLLNHGSICYLSNALCEKLHRLFADLRNRCSLEVSWNDMNSLTSSNPGKSLIMSDKLKAVCLFPAYVILGRNIGNAVLTNGRRIREYGLDQKVRELIALFHSYRLKQIGLID